MPNEVMVDVKGLSEKIWFLYGGEGSPLSGGEGRDLRLAWAERGREDDDDRDARRTPEA